jgi:hypothetical protein
VIVVDTNVLADALLGISGVFPLPAAWKSSTMPKRS